MNIYQLALEFKEKSTSSQTSSILYSRICNARQTIQRIEGIGDETRVKLLFALGAFVDTDFLKQLKEQADVTLDSHQRIIEYKKKEGGFELIKNHNNNKPLPNIAQNYLFSQEPTSPTDWTSNSEYIELTNFLIEITNDVKPPLNITNLAKVFKENSGAPQTVDCIRYRIQVLRQIIHEMNHIDTGVKVKMLLALSVPINNHFLKYLQTRAEVILDNHRRIIKYREKEGDGLELEGDHSIIHEKIKTVRREERMMEFLAQKSMEAGSLLTDRAFVREFKRTIGATETIDHLARRYRRLKQKILASTDFDRKTKVRMMFVSGASVPNWVLEVLRKDALIEIDDKNRIIKYKANDGSLELQGPRSKAANIRAGKIKKRQRNSKEIIDSDSDEEQHPDETEYNHHVQCSGNGKETKNKTIKSGKLSKKRNLDTITYSQKRSRKRASNKSSSKRIKCSETDQLEDCDSSFYDFQMPEVKLEPFSGDLIDEDAHVSMDDDDIEVKLEPFRGSLIRDDLIAPMDPDNEDIKIIPTFEFCEPKKEIEEEQINFESMDYPIKFEIDSIIPKQEELEED